MLSEFSVGRRRSLARNVEQNHASATSRIIQDRCLNKFTSILKISVNSRVSFVSFSCRYKKMKITVKQIKFIQIDTEISSTLYILRILGDKITMKKIK